jgi:putative restriction endonuclease
LISRARKIAARKPSLKLFIDVVRQDLKVLLEAYRGRYAISDCDAVEAPEAAHIAPYRGDYSNHMQNALLLRANLHSLYDLGLRSIDPATMTVVIATE